jgi:23S rRNA A2030 N6-methylase RlmJ
MRERDTMFLSPLDPRHYRRTAAYSFRPELRQTLALIAKHNCLLIEPPFETNRRFSRAIYGSSSGSLRPKGTTTASSAQ